jgi:hypothetical protein
MPDDTPNINLKGYFQEKKGKDAGPISKNPKHEFGAPPVPACNSAQRKGSGKTSKESKKAKNEAAGSSSESDQ